MAARFRGAGLEGGGPEGSFYHETVVRQSRVPTDAVLLQADKQPIVHYGLLSTGEKPCKVQGRVMDVSFDALATPDADLKGLRGVLRGKFHWSIEPSCSKIAGSGS